VTEPEHAAPMAEMIIRYFIVPSVCALDEDLLKLPFVGPEKVGPTPAILTPKSGAHSGVPASCSG
jgi:hypothetical protein